MNDNLRSLALGWLFLISSLLLLLTCPLGRGLHKTVFLPQLVPVLNVWVGLAYVVLQLAVALWFANLRLGATVILVTVAAAAVAFVGTFLLVNLDRHGIPLPRHLVITGGALSGMVIGIGFLRDWWEYRRR
jgi:hypothetical protein